MIVVYFECLSQQLKSFSQSTTQNLQSVNNSKPSVNKSKHSVNECRFQSLKLLNEALDKIVGRGVNDD